MRLEDGGWAQETTIRELPTSAELASVNMRLEEVAYRELHWHTETEWVYVLESSCRISVLDTEGGCSIDDLQKGDLCYFLTGSPHSI
jgi:oxalate decarboxylase/phosphoglucose isomerase-like protein (cupin superfamily)